MFVMDLDLFLCKNVDVADFAFVAFMQFAECHGIVKLFESNMSVVFDEKRENEIEIIQVEWIANDSLQENLNCLISNVYPRKASFKGILNTQRTF